MIVYILNLVFSWIFLLFARKIDQANQKNNLDFKRNRLNIVSKIMIGISFLSVFLVAGLRVSVGTDFEEYTYLFNQYSQMTWSYNSNIEPLFFYFNKLISLFSTNSQWLFVSTALVIYYFYYKIAVQESRYFELSIFLFITLGFYTSSFNTMRQWIACSIVFYAYRYMFKKERKKFIISIFIATFFHYSAAVMFILYLFINKVKTNRTRIFVLLCSTVGTFLYDKILILITKFMTLVNLSVKYYIYVNSFSLNNGRFYVFPIICLIIYIMYLLNKTKLKDINKNIEYQINILTIAYAISMLGQKLYMFLRIQNYFLPIIIIIIPNLVLCFDKKSRIVIYNIILCLGFLFMLYSLSKNGGEPLPYNSILNY